MPPHSHEVMELLGGVQKGDQDAVDHLLEVLYPELRRIAGACFRGERPNHTLQPTALVHEAYLRLVDQRDVAWQNRAHFLAVAARTMRRILLDHARRRAAEKRGGDLVRVTFDDDVAGARDRGAELLDLDAALSDLEAESPRVGAIIECRYFGGMTIDETAEALGVGTATIEREWKFARAWLRRRLAPSGDEST